MDDWTEPPDRSIVIRLSAKQVEQTEFLEGLENWLQLGLLSDWQVKQLGQQHLSCPLPTLDPVAPIGTTARDRASDPLPEPATVATRTDFFADETDFAPPDAANPVTITPSTSAPSTQLPRSSSNRWGRSLQTFMAEISVIWLLFLGVFLVVVSSGVLAASQWQNFPPIGQYAILWVYTLMFFAAGLWTGQRSNLRLTARMLQITTLLIIPVNFWMMGGLGLGQSRLGIFIGGLAALVLTATTVFLLRPQSNLLSTGLSHSSQLSRSSRLIVFNSIGLSWLHWGWSIAVVPVLATYVGTIGTAILLVWQERIWQQTTQTHEAESSPAQLFPSAATWVIAFSTLLLIGRALLIAEVPPRQLGLALGVCGWVWCWLSRPPAFALVTRRQSVWTPVGIALLLLGWGVSVFAAPPWQAIGVSGLGLWLLLDRLRVTGRSEVLLASFLVGLQAYGLLWRLFPVTLRQSLIDFAGQIVGNTALPEALIGLAGLPYLWVTLGVGNWLRQSQREIPAAPPPVPYFRSLVRQAETIAFILGICLTLISLANPGVRSLNLLVSTFTLAWVLWNRSAVSLATSPALIYLTHTTGLIAIVSGVDWWIPTLKPAQWAVIFIGMMAIEWGLSVRGSHADWQNSDWRRSAWYLGLALAGLSYVALQSIAPPVQSSAQTLVWLIVPTLLTGLSCLRQFPPAQWAAWLSTAALCAQLLLLSSLNTWIVALATATALMLVNTQILRHRIAATLTIGFLLGLEATLIWRWLAEQITEDTVLLFLSAILWQLWLLRPWLLRNRFSHVSGDLKQTYATVANGWGIALCGFILLLLTGLSAVAFTTREVSGLQMLGVGLVIGAIGYRIWQQPTNLGFWGLAWAGETALAILMARSGGNLANLGFANLGLGLICQLVGEVWVWQSLWSPLQQTRQQRPYRSSWHLIPLVYAALGLLLVHTTFTAFTGLYTLVAALTGIGVGRRHARFQPLTLLAVLLGSLAAYEWLVYQLLQAEGGNPGDGLTLLAGLSILIAWGNRLLSRWLILYLRIADRPLQVIAHLHWLLGSGLALLAVLDSLSSMGTALLIVTALALSGYALMMGNRNWRRDTEQQSAEPAEPEENNNALSRLVQPESVQLESFQDAWTYAGIAELLATLSYGLYEAVPDTTSLMAWAGAIASVLAVGLYTPPWNRWGWSMHPWRTAAVGFPVIVVLLTATTVALQSLLITAAFYAWFAKTTRQIRLSYLSVLLFDWALLRFGQQQGWLNLLWVSTMLGGSLLYVAQIDPGLQTQSAREQRHWLRSLSTSLVCLTALYQAEVETGGMAIGVGLLTLVLSIGLIFAGLALRIRAFLYVGTATFILRILRWLWLFINTYSLLLWAVGIVLGLIFIWVAATFEARRNQVNAIVDYWSNQLERWE